MIVVWTKDALESLRRVHSHISTENPKTAVRVIRDLKQATEKLTQFPNIGRSGYRPGARELVVSNLPYVVIYRVTDSEVQILQVFHAKQYRQ